jgi:hypothetical protein
MNTNDLKRNQDVMFDLLLQLIDKLGLAIREDISWSATHIGSGAEHIEETKTYVLYKKGAK